MANDDDDDSFGAIGTPHYAVMPSLQALQIMRNRLHTAFLGKRLMKMTALATARELRTIADDITVDHDNLYDSLMVAYMSLAKCRYFFPQLADLVITDVGREAYIKTYATTKNVATAKMYFLQAKTGEEKHERYKLLCIGRGGEAAKEAKELWRDILLRIIAMTELMTNFKVVYQCNKDATRKLNIMRKIIIPRTIITIKYILNELEEREREDFFRMKIVKKNKMKTQQPILPRVVEEETPKKGVEFKVPLAVVTPIEPTKITVVLPTPTAKRPPAPVPVSPAPCIAALAPAIPPTMMPPPTPSAPVCVCTPAPPILQPVQVAAPTAPPCVAPQAAPCSAGTAMPAPCGAAVSLPPPCAVSMPGAPCAAATGQAKPCADALALRWPCVAHTIIPAPCTSVALSGKPCLAPMLAPCGTAIPAPPPAGPPPPQRPIIPLPPPAPAPLRPIIPLPPPRFIHPPMFSKPRRERRFPCSVCGPCIRAKKPIPLPPPELEEKTCRTEDGVAPCVECRVSKKSLQSNISTQRSLQSKKSLPLLPKFSSRGQQALPSKKSSTLATCPVIASKTLSSAEDYILMQEVETDAVSLISTKASDLKEPKDPAVDQLQAIIKQCASVKEVLPLNSAIDTNIDGFIKFCSNIKEYLETRVIKNVPPVCKKIYYRDASLKEATECCKSVLSTIIRCACPEDYRDVVCPKAKKRMQKTKSSVTIKKPSSCRLLSTCSSIKKHSCAAGSASEPQFKSKSPSRKSSAVSKASSYYLIRTGSGLSSKVGRKSITLRIYDSKNTRSRSSSDNFDVSVDLSICDMDFKSNVYEKALSGRKPWSEHRMKSLSLVNSRTEQPVKQTCSNANENITISGSFMSILQQYLAKPTKFSYDCLCQSSESGGLSPKNIDVESINYANIESPPKVNRVTKPSKKVYPIHKCSGSSPKNMTKKK